MSVPGCPEPVAGAGGPLYCRLMQGLIGRGAYAPWVQSHVVQAQYVKVARAGREEGGAHPLPGSLQGCLLVG